MKKYILKSLFVSMLCMLAASCQDTNEFEQTLDSSKAQVMFSVAMDSPMSRSRGLTWGDEYTPDHIGDIYDNRIDPNQLVVKIEAGGKTYKVNDIVKKQVGEVNEYTFVGVVEGIKQTTPLSNAKVTVFANMGRNAENLTFAQNAECIPMWGMRTENLTLTPGERAPLSAISLLRAMAKIEVSLNADMTKQYALTGATLNRHNPTGNSLPTIKEGAKHTTDLELEGVFNPLSGSQLPLAFEKAEKGNSYVVYLPEVARGKSDADHLNIEVQLNAKDEAGNLIKGAIEKGNFNVFDYSKNVDSPEVIDIVRNHWYKYNISGFAAGQIEVNYQAMDWNGVDINVGGEGFLFLNKDVIEIYNSNIDADQLKFSSSTPIKSIVLKDIYKHENDGTFTEGTKLDDGSYDGDDVSAYYITKFGQKIQLGDEPGFDFDGEAEALAKEKEILEAISAVPVYDETGLNGGITINSPYIGHATYGNSHYNTIRYLEFEVTNEQDLTATFRVMQYPPVVITNEEGYLSYRDDFTRKTGEGPAYWGNYPGPGAVTTLALTLYHEHDWTEEANRPQSWWDTRQSDRDYGWLDDGSYPWLPENNADPLVLGHEQWEEIRYLFVGDYVTFISHEKATNGKELTNAYSGGYRPYGPNGEAEGYATEAFVRSRYWNLPGAASAKMEKQGVAIGPYYEKEVVINEETGEKQKRIFRKHYTWNVQPVFYSKYVSKIYKADGKNASNRVRLKGQADIHNLMDGSFPDDIQTNFNIYNSPRLYRNHRMYHIKATSSDKYILGRPQLVDKEGNPTSDTERGMTANTPSNANLVSPYFAVASQLGETDYNYIVEAAKKAGYNLPVLSDFFKLAENHCREYVEASYEDLNGNGQYDSATETLVHYRDWRLPTKKEIEMIIDYQNNSRAMDKVLIGEHFICITGNPGKGNNEEYWVSSEVPGYKVSASEDLDGIAYDNYGYYIRCVRDVKP